MPEVNEQYAWPTGHHPDMGDPELNHMQAHEVERLREVNEREAAARATAGTKPEDPPLVTGKALKLTELDSLKYKVLVERAQRLQLLLEKKASEFRQAQEQQRTNSEELGALLDSFGVKYGLDFHNQHITEDGTIVPNGPR